MKIIIQPKKIDKHTSKVIDEEISLSNDNFDGGVFATLQVADTYVDIDLANFFTAIEAFIRHQRRFDDDQLRMMQHEKLGEQLYNERFKRQQKK